MGLDGMGGFACGGVLTYGAVSAGLTKNKNKKQKKEAQLEVHFQVCFITIVILYCTGIMKSNTVPLCCSQRCLTFLSL